MSAVVLLLPACSGAGNEATAGQSSFTLSTPLSPTSLDIAADQSAGAVDGLDNELLEDLGANGSLTPALATSVTTPNDTTLVYHLRKNVRFSNGDPLTAQDVAWSIRHDFAPGAVVAAYFDAVKDVSVTGIDEVTVHLSHYDPPARQFIGIFGHVYEAAQAQAHPKDFGSSNEIPVGTGPYRVTKFSTDGATLERNPNYWGTAPRFKQIKYVYIAQDNTAQLAMRSGSIQGSVLWNSAGIPQWKSIPGARIYPVPPAANTFVSMDVTSPPFNDIHLRKAIAYAVDRAGLSQAIYHGESQVTPSIVQAGMISSVAPSVANADAFLKQLPQYGFDLVKAKEELAQSAYPHGLTFKLSYNSGNGIWAIIAQNMQHTLGSIGITVQLQPFAGAAWVDQVLGHKNLGILLNLFAGFGPADPNSNLGVLVGKANAVVNGFNFANYYPPSEERAFQVLMQSHDKAARWRATEDILTDVATDVPYIPLFTAPQPLAMSGGFQAPNAGIDSTALYYTGKWIYSVH